MYTRETIPWSLECDLNRLSRQDALEKVLTMEGGSRVDYEGVEIMNIVHYMVAGMCVGLSILMLLTPTGTCICFMAK